MGVMRLYPLEWDWVTYPSEFEVPTLQTFDGQGSLNLHMTLQNSNRQSGFERCHLGVFVHWHPQRSLLEAS